MKKRYPLGLLGTLAFCLISAHASVLVNPEMVKTDESYYKGQKYCNFTVHDASCSHAGNCDSANLLLAQSISLKQKVVFNSDKCTVSSAGSLPSADKSAFEKEIADLKAQLAACQSQKPAVTQEQFKNLENKVDSLINAPKPSSIKIK